MITPNKYGVFEQHTKVLECATETGALARILLVETDNGWHYGLEWMVPPWASGGFFPSISKPALPSQQDAIDEAAKKIKYFLIKQRPCRPSNQDILAVQELVFWCEQRLQAELFCV